MGYVGPCVVSFSLFFVFGQDRDERGAGGFGAKLLSILIENTDLGSSFFFLRVGFFFRMQIFFDMGNLKRWRWMMGWLGYKAGVDPGGEGTFIGHLDSTK